MKKQINLNNHITFLNRKTTLPSKLFQESTITEETIQGILEAALTTPPCYGAQQNTHLVLCDEVDLLVRLSEVFGSDSHIVSLTSDAAFCLVVLHSPQFSPHWREEAAVVATHARLQAISLGLTAHWVHISERESYDGGDAGEYVKRILGIPYQMEVVCLLFIGKTQQSQPMTSYTLKGVLSMEQEDLPWELLHINEFSL
ncbi:MAG: hypothetical protein SPI35_05580 [Porphyromonas sp.]|nr:hypothetical protein [Porphyromonas sp.]